MCITCYDMRMSHLNEDYLLTYLLTDDDGDNMSTAPIPLRPYLFCFTVPLSATEVTSYWSDWISLRSACYVIYFTCIRMFLLFFFIFLVLFAAFCQYPITMLLLLMMMSQYDPHARQQPDCIWLYMVMLPRSWLYYAWVRGCTSHSSMHQQPNGKTQSVVTCPDRGYTVVLRCYVLQYRSIHNRIIGHLVSK